MLDSCDRQVTKDAAAAPSETAARQEVRPLLYRRSWEKLGARQNEFQRHLWYSHGTIQCEQSRGTQFETRLFRVLVSSAVSGLNSTDIEQTN